MIEYRCDRCDKTGLRTAYNLDIEPADGRPWTMGERPRHYELCMSCIEQLRFDFIGQQKGVVAGYIDVGHQL